MQNVCTQPVSSSRVVSNRLFSNNDHPTYNINATTVRGIVIAQNKLNCGLMPTPMELGLALLALSQSNRGAEKSAARKFPGRNKRASSAKVFIEDADCSPTELSLRAIRLKI